MPAARNPLLDFVLVIVASAVLVPLTASSVLLIDFFGFFESLWLFFEAQWLQIYILGVSFGIGLAIGRKSSFGWTASAGAFIGGFPGAYIFQAFILPASIATVLAVAPVLFTLGMGGLCGLGGLAGHRLVRPKTRRFEVTLRQRRCTHCGTRVGPSARRCWSCRSALPRT